MKPLTFLLLALILPACSKSSKPLSYSVVSTLPHDPQCYTQGLEFIGDRLIESSGGYGHSSIRHVNPTTGEVITKRPLASNVFVEGLTYFNNEIWILTWQENTAYVFDPISFKFLREYKFSGEGWGLTHDNTHLIMSDGSNHLKFIDPSTFQVVKTISVTRNGSPVNLLNELEMVNGEIFANIYQSDEIVRINPTTGKVTGSLSLAALRNRLPSPNRAEALNGIALNPKNGNLLITGKLWPKMFEIQIQSNP